MGVDAYMYTLYKGHCSLSRPGRFTNKEVAPEILCIKVPLGPKAV